jgi:hypothetical protein
MLEENALDAERFFHFNAIKRHVFPMAQIRKAG